MLLGLQQGAEAHRGDECRLLARSRERLLHQPLTGGTRQPQTQWQGRLCGLHRGRRWSAGVSLSPQPHRQFCEDPSLCSSILSRLLGLPKV